MQYGILPTVPQYYMDFIDAKVDLVKSPKQLCPFHKDSSTPSFSFDIRSGRWSCFGACHAHGDVIEMHRRWMHLNSKEEAEADLCAKYRVPKPTMQEKLTKIRAPKIVPIEEVKSEVAYLRAIELAVTPEDWVELDVIMGEYPVDFMKLQNFNSERMSRYE